ncbi:nitroreductase [Labedaea rhizosphaerae]|uniref:Nitroreductase n=1 Tax=Labedaea rhizosphaerae TaxID=598644 RepID=A0A4R6SLV1_LABRH|nr:nitroreductase [Labedaea rhizosphaerae]
MIAQRWSPRALVPTATVPDEALRSMLEAARWAPSWGNTQPARYLVGRRGDATFGAIFETLSRGNKSWAGAAAVLLLACAVTVNEKGDLPLPEYGVGLATENLVLQAVAKGFVAHQMGGFDRDAARSAFALPDDVRPLVVVAIGVLGSPDLLPEERRERETRPRQRLPLAELAFTDTWGKPARF